jgi:hypothetical protein
VKVKLCLCLALALSGRVFIPAHAAQPQPLPTLQVVVIPFTTNVCVRESFALELRVENVARTNQTIQFMNCSRWDSWQFSNTNVSWISPLACAANSLETVTIPPGGAYERWLYPKICNPVRDHELSFRVGFNSAGSTNTLWSDEVKLRIIPSDDLTKVNLGNVLKEIEQQVPALKATSITTGPTLVCVWRGEDNGMARFGWNMQIAIGRYDSVGEAHRAIEDTLMMRQVFPTSKQDYKSATLYRYKYGGVLICQASHFDIEIDGENMPLMMQALDAILKQLDYGSDDINEQLPDGDSFKRNCPLK